MVAGGVCRRRPPQTHALKRWRHLKKKILKSKILALRGAWQPPNPPAFTLQMRKSKAKRHELPKVRQPVKGEPELAFVPPVISFYMSFFFFFFLGPYLWHMEVPRLGGESELQLSAYTINTAMRDPGHICDLHQSSRQCRILNPMSEARDRSRILMDPSRAYYLPSHEANPPAHQRPLPPRH